MIIFVGNGTSMDFFVGNNGTWKRSFHCEQWDVDDCTCQQYNVNACLFGQWNFEDVFCG